MGFVRRYVFISSVVTSIGWMVAIILYWNIQDHTIHLLNIQTDEASYYGSTGSKHNVQCPIFPRPEVPVQFDETDPSKLVMIFKPEDQQMRDSGYKKYGFNELVSERMGFYRFIPDVRHRMCRSLKYPDILPSTTVVICFYNEAWSVLLRTIYSVLIRSPPGIVCEIILVDDSSDLPHLGPQLDKFIAANLTPIVKLFRTVKREGLIRARMFGADRATSEVLVFLDSHCEVNIGWLEPLLSHVKHDRRNIAIPVIDIINQDTFVYEASPLVRGGFNWGMFYRWDHIPDISSDDSFIYPVKTPTMAGGLFAMNRQYFNELGKYDPGLDTWGGENLELSFRVWQCGGRMDIIPCSRVGHVFRNHRPYGNLGGVDSMTQNSLRVVHVWLDEYKEYFFQIRPDARNMSYGDISQRVALRKQLDCKPFSWYLSNVYPEQTFPDKLNPMAGGVPKGFDKQFIKQKSPKLRRIGTLRHSLSGQCVVGDRGIYEKKSLVKLSSCSVYEKNQQWHELEQFSLQLAGVLCLDFEDVLLGISYVRLAKCHFSGGSQEWKWMNSSKLTGKSLLLNPASGRCMTIDETGHDRYLTLNLCNENNPTQHFEFLS